MLRDPKTLETSQDKCGLLAPSPPSHGPGAVEFSDKHAGRLSWMGGDHAVGFLALLPLLFWSAGPRVKFVGDAEMMFRSKTPL